MNWVVGFIFSEDLKRVLLIKKLRGPSFNVGKYNGGGGKVEKDECASWAIERESREEFGLDLKDYDWSFTCRLNTNLGYVYFFSIRANIDEAKQMESEPIAIFNVEEVVNDYSGKFAGNLNWLIPMSINVLLKRDHCRSFDIQEEYE